MRAPGDELLAIPEFLNFSDVGIFPNENDEIHDGSLCLVSGDCVERAADVLRFSTPGLAIHRSSCCVYCLSIIKEHLFISQLVCRQQSK
jgi:hypothetical protein